MTNKVFKKIKHFYLALLSCAKPIRAKASNANVYTYIDISQWQGKVNFEKVKKAGVQGIIIRIGYGDVISYPSQVDIQFERNYAECKRLGIPVGGYFYSYATTPREAKREAQGCLKLITGKQFELPILYDVEEMCIFQTRRTNEIIQAFCSELEAHNWWTGIYIYRSAAQTYLTDYTRTRYAMAIAEYGPKLNYSGPYGIWQNSSTWRVDGISGNVDHDWCYVDYPKLIKERGKNGYPKPAPKLMYQVTKDTPIVQFEGTEPAGKTVQVYGRKTICGVQYGRVTKDGWISLKDAKQV